MVYEFYGSLSGSDITSTRRYGQATFALIHVEEELGVLRDTFNYNT